MSTLAWIILLILILPAIGLLVWVILAASLVRVPSGSLGLVMSRGKATDRSLLPGGHFVHRESSEAFVAGLTRFVAAR